jgi:hypothetical protein
MATTDQQRAEEKVGEAERALKDATTRAGDFFIHVLARAREEAEDIWAEARSVSRSHK